MSTHKLLIALTSLLFFIPFGSRLTAQGLTSNPNSHQFPLVAVGQSSNAQNFTISNPSNSPVTISEVRFRGLNPEDFSTTLNTPVTINAQGSQVLSVVFTPEDDSPDIRSATMEIVNNGVSSPLRVDLAGSTVDNNPDPNAIRINSGANPGKTVTYNGAAWTWDKFVTGGGTFFSAQEIANTTYDSLFYWERIGPSFTYDIPLGNLNANSYVVELHFAEIFFNNPSNRVMDVSIEGALVLDDFDIVAEAGTRAAIVKKFEIAPPGDGTISIAFNAVKDQAKISAIKIVPRNASLLPVAEFSSQPGAVPFSVNFDASASTSSQSNIVSYVWDFGDGNTGTGVQTSHTYAAPGSYNVKLTVQDALGGNNSITKSVAAVDPSQAAIRINTGGFEVNVNGNIWLQDQFFDGGGTFGTTNDIAGTDADTLYKTEHFGEFSYNVPINNLPGDDIEVEMHFAEIFFTAPNNRVFDISIEGVLKYNDFDIVAEAGSFTAFVVRDTIPRPADNVVTVSFTKVKDNPKISALKIGTVTQVVSNQPPQANFTAILGPVSRSIEFDGRISADSDGSIASYQWNFGDGTTGNGPLLSYRYATPGEYLAQLIVTDDLGEADTISQTLLITEANPNPDVMRINSGGDAITLGGEEWQADQYFEGGSVFSNSTEIANTLADPIYQSLRTGAFSYKIPLDSLQADQYRIIFHFSELVFTNTARRLFDVEVEGQTSINNFDIVAEDGAFSAYKVGVNIDAPTDDTLNINFITALDLPVISGIEIYAGDPTPRQPDLANELGLRVFPNPVRRGTLLNLSLDKSSFNRLSGQVINAQGQRIQTFTWHTGNTASAYTLPLGQVPAGLYHLLLTDENGRNMHQAILIKE